MNYFGYKVLHLASLALLFLSLGLIIVGTTLKQLPPAVRRTSFALHGLSWLALFVSAFGLVSALGLHQNFPLWAKLKTAIWLLLGLGVFFIRWKHRWTIFNVGFIAVLGCLAIWLAVAKPAF